MNEWNIKLKSSDISAKAKGLKHAEADRINVDLLIERNKLLLDSRGKDCNFNKLLQNIKNIKRRHHHLLSSAHSTRSSLMHPSNSIAKS